MNTAKYYVTIHFQVIEIDIWEVVILLMIYPKELVQNKRKDLNLTVLI